jgi:hypothetical protein
MLRKDLNTAFPEQRIAGLRPAYPERRNPGIRPALPEQRFAGLRPAYPERRNRHLAPAPPPAPAINSVGPHTAVLRYKTAPQGLQHDIPPSNASQVYGLHTPSDAIPAFGRHSPEQRIAGLRPAYPERRNRHLVPAPPPAPYAPAINSVGPHTAVLRYKNARKDLNTAFPEQRIDRRPTACTSRATQSAGNASQAYGL